MADENLLSTVEKILDHQPKVSLSEDDLNACASVCADEKIIDHQPKVSFSLLEHPLENMITPEVVKNVSVSLNVVVQKQTEASSDAANLSDVRKYFLAFFCCCLWIMLFVSF